MSLTPEQRILRARAAALTRWSRPEAAEQGRAIAQRGQDGLVAKFAREIDPDGKLPASERYKLAERRRDAHMARLALASSKARARRAGKAPVDNRPEDAA